MQHADAAYYEALGNVSMKAVTNAVPKAWAAKAKAYAAAKAQMPQGPPQVRDEYNQWLAKAAPQPMHHVILDRALGAPAKAKAHAAAQGGAAELNSTQTTDAIHRADDLSKNIECELATTRLNLKRQRDRQHPMTKVDSSKVARNTALQVLKLDQAIDKELEKFVDDSGL